MKSSARIPSRLGEGQLGAVIFCEAAVCGVESEQTLSNPGFQGHGLASVIGGPWVPGALSFDRGGTFDRSNLKILVTVWRLHHQRRRHERQMRTVLSTSASLVKKHPWEYYLKPFTTIHAPDARGPTAPNSCRAPSQVVLEPTTLRLGTRKVSIGSLRRPAGRRPRCNPRR